MRFSKIIFFTVVTTFGIISCQKIEVVDNIAGEWEGNWGWGTEVPSYYEKWVLEKDGELKSYYPDGSLYAIGTWECEGNDFEAEYSPLGETYSYIFSGEHEDGEIEGTWDESPSAIDGGTFEMEKR